MEPYVDLFTKNLLFRYFETLPGDVMETSSSEYEREYLSDPIWELCPPFAELVLTEIRTFVPYYKGLYIREHVRKSKTISTGSKITSKWITNFNTLK